MEDPCNQPDGSGLSTERWTVIDSVEATNSRSAFATSPFEARTVRIRERTLPVVASTPA